VFFIVIDKSWSMFIQVGKDHLFCVSPEKTALTRFQPVAGLLKVKVASG